MRFYDVIVFIHVLSALVLVGGGLLATPTVDAAIRRAPTISELRRWLTVGRPLGQINPISSLTLLASGIYLASAGDWWHASWVQVALALWLINTIVAAVLVRPAMADLARLASASDGENIGPQLESLRKSPRLTLGPETLLANDLGVLFLMVVKPSGYVTAAVAVVVAQAVLNGVRPTWQMVRSARSLTPPTKGREAKPDVSGRPDLTQSSAGLLRNEDSQ